MSGRRRRSILGLLLAVSVGSFGTAAAGAERVALVIGNGLYRHVGTLPNPSNDARAITAALEAVGFEVVAGYDLDADGMAGVVERFELELDGARVGLVYYAGHGLGMDGVNYLLPVDLKLESKSAVKRDAVSVDWLLNDVMQGGEERVTILMLDACRNNPFARSFAARTRGEVGNGLAEVQAKTGAYIAFATAPDNVASDGSGGNSPFTAAVLRHLPTPGLEINDMMTLVRNEVHTPRPARPSFHGPTRRCSGGSISCPPARLPRPRRRFRSSPRSRPLRSCGSLPGSASKPRSCRRRVRGCGCSRNSRRWATPRAGPTAGSARAPARRSATSRSRAALGPRATPTSRR